MTKPLFNMFDSVSEKQWKQKIQADLKGADYNDTLIWKSNEGIDVKPFYHAEDSLKDGRFSIPNNSWEIGKVIYVSEDKKANSKALRAIENGAEAITFIIPNKEVSIIDLIHNLPLIPIHLELEFLDSAYIDNIKKLPVSIHIDIIGNLTKTGNWFTSLREDHAVFESITKHTQTLHVDMTTYQNAGANMVQQLAYGLAHANEYLNHLERADFNITFKVAVGTNYFFEIAKLRALRLLWNTLASEYGASKDCSIIVFPTRRNKTLYDYNTNMLRTTTECMSAILGGANTIYNLPYDAIYHKDNEFGERISRNQLLVLKHESYFDSVQNASEGSYYIENLTLQLANKALELFKNIETNSGFLKQLKSGTIQKKIKESANKEQEQFNNGDITLLGTNKYPNPKDLMSQELELYPFVKIVSRKTIIEPIIEKRLAESIEKERLKTETNN